MNTMPEQNVRPWLALRRCPREPSKSFLFWVNVVIDAEKLGLYGAHVAGMEDTMAAAGYAPEEAEENAHQLFMDVVDDALEADASLSFVIGNSNYTLLNIPIDKAPQFFAALEMAVVREDDNFWRHIPPHSLPSHGSEAVTP